MLNAGSTERINISAVIIIFVFILITGAIIAVVISIVAWKLCTKRMQRTVVIKFSVEHRAGELAKALGEFSVSNHACTLIINGHHITDLCRKGKSTLLV